MAAHFWNFKPDAGFFSKK